MSHPIPRGTSRDQILRAISNLLDGVEDPGPHVIMPGEDGSPLWEPTDAKQPTAVSSLETTANGGTEIKFSGESGVIVSGPGAVGVYWRRAINDRWMPLLQGRHISYNAEAGFFVGTNNAGVTPGGVLSLEFFAKPPGMNFKQWSKTVYEWTRGSGADMSTGVISGVISGATMFGGTDVTLGTFSQLFSAAAEQIFLAGSNMLVGGATKKCQVLLATPYTNTDEIYVGESAALAVASNNPLSATGQDTWSVPAGGKLFFKSASGTQKVSARVRTA